MLSHAQAPQRLRPLPASQREPPGAASRSASAGRHAARAQGERERQREQSRCARSQRWCVFVFFFCPPEKPMTPSSSRAWSANMLAHACARTEAPVSPGRGEERGAGAAAHREKAAPLTTTRIRYLLSRPLRKRAVKAEGEAAALRREEQMREEQAQRLTEKAAPLTTTRIRYSPARYERER